MFTLKESFCQSAKEIFSLRSMAGAGLLLAVCIVLSIFNIPITPSLKVSFAFLSFGVVGMLYGPVMGLMVGALCDILQYLIMPQGAYFPGFTINTALTGLVFGLFLYRGQISWLRLILARLITNVIINILLGTLWNSILLGKGYLLLLPSRALKNLIMLPFEVVLLYLLLTAVLKILPKTGLMKDIHRPGRNECRK